MRTFLLHKIHRYKLLLMLVILLTAIPLTGATQYQKHKVRKGDTLYSLSKRYGVTVEQIMKLNNMRNNNLAIGQSLKIKPLEPKPKPPRPAETAPKPVQTPAETTPVTTGISADTKELPEDYYHLVKPKENLFRIALNSNITLADLLKFNNFPDERIVIKPGQKLKIKDPAAYQKPIVPTMQREQPAAVTTEPAEQSAPEDSVLIEKVYIVQRKDTLFRISRENNMTVEQLKKLNNLRSNELKVGQKLYIIAPRGREEPVSTIKPISEEDIRSNTQLRKDLIMPTEGKILSEFGIRNGRPHKGIDICALNGIPIFAVLDGIVVYAGLQGNYGNVVVLEHPDYVMTVYGHNEQNLVAVGDVVKQGQIIATVGSTGNATTSHLHFEYRIKGKAINPRRVLPFGQ